MKIQSRRALQWVLLPIMLITIALGWKYPLLGFSVPIVMLMGMVGGLVNGRYVCGHLCPRGGFFDRMLAPVAGTRKTPAFLRGLPFRLVVLVALMGFMVFRLAQNPGEINHWGRVFWMICVITTAVAVILAFPFNARTWCAFCPMGTLQNLFDRLRARRIAIDADRCRECRACEKACPMGLEIVKHKDSGVLADPDCLKCSECIAVCPAKALDWKKEEESENPRPSS